MQILCSSLKEMLAQRGEKSVGLFGQIYPRELYVTQLDSKLGSGASASCRAHLSAQDLREVLSPP